MRDCGGYGGGWGVLFCVGWVFGGAGGWGQGGFSAVGQLGRTSLLVYWVHIEFVYGRLSILPKGRCGIAAATAGLCLIFVAMLGLSVARTRWKGKTEKSEVRM